MKTLSCCMALALLSACATSPNTRYYTLTAMPSTPLAQNDSAATYSVAVAPITLPESIDRSQLVVRHDTHRVDVLDAHRWAEALKREVPRVIAHNIAQELPSWRVAAYPQHAANDANYVVFIDIQRFDLIANTGSVMEALWSVRHSDRTVVLSRRFVVREAATGGDNEALVAAHSRALASLSKEIAQSLRAQTAQR